MDDRERSISTLYGVGEALELMDTEDLDNVVNFVAGPADCAQARPPVLVTEIVAEEDHFKKPEGTVEEAGQAAMSPMHPMHRDETASPQRNLLTRAERKQKAAQRKKNMKKRKPEKPKSCTVCGTVKGMLIRCQIDESAEWHLLCGRCWKEYSGGETEGTEEFPHYRYGGVWKAR
mmetsp:Transcript_3136/g.8940  ORF Transcript_3136/g.8940 Transcript_3136/m.8940 type:complete len:175 (-) Transcript_3136:892-1416(-)